MSAVMVPDVSMQWSSPWFTNNVKEQAECVDRMTDTNLSYYNFTWVSNTRSPTAAPTTAADAFSSAHALGPANVGASLALLAATLLLVFA
jgi:hypothetical protein